MENIISMVRTFAPLTSTQTVSRINTYLPAVEKVSTLLGMYSFLSRAQNFRPIQTLDAKTPVDKITALLKNGNIPVTKLMAQPLLANNMDKIVGAVAMNMAKNGGLNEILSSLTKGNNSGLNELLSSLANGNKNGLNDILSSVSSDGNKEGNTDISSLLETFMPMINNIMSSSQEDKNGSNEPLEHSDNEHSVPPSTEKNIKNEKHVQKPIRIRQRRK